MSSAGSAGRRGGTIYPAYIEPPQPSGPSTIVDGLLLLSGFVMLVTLVFLVMQIG